MIEIFLPFINQILSFCGFKPSHLPKKYYQDLVTALGSLAEQEVVMIPSLIEMVKPFPGVLIIDDTSNPKYGLSGFTRTMKNYATQANFMGYKILVFLWQVGQCRFPIGFALCHAKSSKPEELTLRGLSELRNHYELKPLWTLGDAGFSTDEIVKRLENYRWAFVLRSKKNRKLNGQQAKQAIGRGYGEYCGILGNGVKVKMVRRKKFFVLCNRLLQEGAKILAIYRNRWAIEEVFRFLKSCIGLDRCHQHTMKAQAIYLILCMILLSCFELYSGDSGQSTYYLHRQVILGHLPFKNVLKEELFSM